MVFSTAAPNVAGSLGQKRSSRIVRKEALDRRLSPSEIGPALFHGGRFHRRAEGAARACESREGGRDSGLLWEDVESAAKNVAKAGTPRH